MPSFLDHLDADIRAGLVQRLRVEWTHHSTAIEGNTLTEGETAFVLAEGLTISGKSLKDHQEVVGHARAIDLLKNLIDAREEISEDDLFALHADVQTSAEVDIMKPVGKWKVEPNGAMVVVKDKAQFNDTYALPSDVPALMKTWLRRANQAITEALQHTEAQSLERYCDLHAGFVRVHPFADGNGRMARLLANLPVLAAGRPPILVPRQERITYLRLLAQWQLGIGHVHPQATLTGDHPYLDELRLFFQRCWSHSLHLVEEARAVQRQRHS